MRNTKMTVSMNFSEHSQWEVAKKPNKRTLALFIALALAWCSVLAFPATVYANENLPEMHTVSIGWEPGFNVDFRWGAQLFSAPSSDYNSDIALAAICMEKTLHDSNSDIINKFTNLIGFDGCEIYEPSITLPKFAIAHKNIRVNGEDTVLIAVILAGTTTAFEWLSNLNVSKSSYCGYSIHAGFKSYADEAWKALSAFLSENQELPTRKKLLISGLSSGGAVASLLGVKLITEQTIAQKDDIFVYTFASPNTYSGASTRTIFDNIFNIVCVQDLVPKLPSGIFFSNWQKFGRVLSFSSNSSMVHNQSTYIYGTPKAQFVDNSPQFSFLGFFEWLFSAMKGMFGQ